jgi:hypothetical protein
MSELSDMIDRQIGEIERLRELHAETLIEHSQERDRWAEHLKRYQNALEEVLDELQLRDELHALQAIILLALHRDALDAQVRAAIRESK